MAKVFVFPGQGSQSIGMGKTLYDEYPVAKAVFDEVDEALDESLSSLIFEGDEEVLRQTSNTQPALMAVSIATIRALEHETGKSINQLCDYVAGHSLGEYSALCAVGSIALDDTARCLRIRGNAMQSAVPSGKGGMAALIGVDATQAESLAKDASSEGACEIANDNGGGQIVLSGEMAAIDRLIALATEQGVKRAVKLPVSAPFHSSLMQPAAQAMADALAAVNVHAPSVTLIANVTAREASDPDTIRQLLVEQVTGSVRWRETIEYLVSLSVEQCIEIGAGKVLSGLAKRIDKSLQSTSIQTADDVRAYAASINS